MTIIFPFIITKHFFYTQHLNKKIMAVYCVQCALRSFNKATLCTKKKHHNATGIPSFSRSSNIHNNENLGLKAALKAGNDSVSLGLFS